MHKRQAIRAAVATAITGLNTTGNKVFVSRVYPIDKNSLPGICVFTKREDSAAVTVNRPRTFERELTINAEIYVRGIEGYDNQIDTICAEIEAALYAAGDLNGLVLDLQVVGADVNYQDGAEQPIASCDLEIRAMYTTDEDSVTI
jgi:hypothetical protein